MLTIRQAQIAVFSQLELQKFEDRTLAHLRKFFPSQAAALGEPKLRESIRYGIERAAHHGITDRRDVCRYIDLMLVFGREFDTDPHSKWAAGILRQPKKPATRIQALLMAAKLRLKNR